MERSEQVVREPEDTTSAPTEDRAESEHPVPFEVAPSTTVPAEPAHAPIRANSDEPALPVPDMMVAPDTVVEPGPDAPAPAPLPENAAADPEVALASDQAELATRPDHPVAAAHGHPIRTNAPVPPSAAESAPGATAKGELPAAVPPVQPGPVQPGPVQPGPVQPGPVQQTAAAATERPVPPGLETAPPAPQGLVEPAPEVRVGATQVENAVVQGAVPQARPVADGAHADAAPIGPTPLVGTRAPLGVRVAEPATALTSPRLAETVLDQVRLKLAPELRQATVELEPANLGKLFIRLHVEDGEMTAFMRAERPETLAVLQDHVPELRAMLERAGLQPGSLEFALAQDEASDAGSERSGGEQHEDNASSEVERLLDIREMHTAVLADDAVDFYA
ncbi:MAG: hypothetical protein GY711_20080 [bacterium]|nr:hypothetical protein [bacterium]